MSEIVITGLGVWSAAGVSPDELWANAVSGTSSARWHTVGTQRLAACRAPDPSAPPGFPAAHRLDRSAQLALAAAGQAHGAARLTTVDPARLGVVVGNSRGPVGLWSAPPRTRVRPTQAMHTAVAAISGALSMALPARGPCLTLSATCASGAHALAVGASLIQSQVVDVVIAGGAEAPLTEPLVAQFLAAGLLGQHPDPAWACRPFDARRNGMVPGEGAAFLVLESHAHAHARGISPLAALAGFALGAEAYRRAGPRPDGSGLADTIRQALAHAGVVPAQVGYVNAHGTGTAANDTAEAAALRRVFGLGPAFPAVSSTKGITGHTFGAAAALEAVITVQALRYQSAPPTCGCAAADPALALPVVRPTAQSLDTAFALSTSLGFWGNTAALIFGRP